MLLTQPKAYKLHEWQEAAVDHLYEHDRALVLAKVGAGKTAVALTGMQEMLVAGVVKRWLVLAPLKVARDVWAAEPGLWAPHLAISFALGTPRQRQAAFSAQSSVVVMNYENIQSLSDLSDFDGIVFDELTKLKDSSGKRFKHLIRLIEGINIRWGLTGSFTSNGLEDTFGQCKAVDQQLLGRSKSAFLRRFFFCTNPEYNLWEPLKGSLESVMNIVHPITYVLEAKAYTAPIPNIVPVPLKMDLAPYEKMRQTFVLEFPNAKAVANNAAIVTAKLQQLASGFVYETTRTPNPDKPGKFITYRKPIKVSEHKIDALSHLLDENQRLNTIVVYNFDEEREMLQARFPQARTLDSPNAIDEWNNGKIEILLLHPKSAGHGLNLQFGGYTMVFYSLPWSYELFEQVIGRLCRQGQKFEVTVYTLLTNGTIEERMRDNLKDLKQMSEIAMEALRP